MEFDVGDSVVERITTHPPSLNNPSGGNAETFNGITRNTRIVRRTGTEVLTASGNWYDHFTGGRPPECRGEPYRAIRHGPLKATKIEPTA